MSLARIHTRAQLGIQAPEVCVEVHLGNGLPSLSIVGLPEAAVRESKDRVRAALLNSQFEFPARRITVNLAPADLPKEGGRYDLPIALGVLAASGQIPDSELGRMEFLGELALGGELRRVRGVLPAALAARDSGREIVVPADNAPEAALVEGLVARPAAHLLEVCRHLAGEAPLHAHQGKPPPASWDDVPDLADVRGQHQARRALEVAAAGMHNLLMIGPPGTGKSMLASRLPGILPPMDEDEALESAIIASISEQGFAPAQWGRRPFRAPHHTASGPALVGGGSQPRPGEISLAHRGVLFLDELTEFDRRVLEVLREPMETGHITISRAARQADFPARFQLIAAMNPCPQGYACDFGPNCRCTPEQQRGTAAASPPRCSIASTSRSRCRSYRAKPCAATPRAASQAPGYGRVWPPPANASSKDKATPTPGWGRATSTGIAPCARPSATCSSRRCNASGCRRGPITASSRWPAPSPTWRAARP